MSGLALTSAEYVEISMFLDKCNVVLLNTIMRIIDSVLRMLREQQNKSNSIRC